MIFFKGERGGWFQNKIKTPVSLKWCPLSIKKCWLFLFTRWKRKLSKIIGTRCRPRVINNRNFESARWEGKWVKTTGEISSKMIQIQDMFENWKPDIVQGFHIKRTPFLILISENSFKLGIVFLVRPNNVESISKPCSGRD